MLPLLFSFILSSLLINIECQQTLPMFRGQSTGASNNAQVVVQMTPNQQSQQSQQSQQQQQPQLLTLQQQQQLIQQLNALQQQAKQQQQSQPQQTNAQQPQYVLAPQQQPQFAVLPQQQPPQQQFFDPSQQQPPQQQFFDPNQQPPPQFFQADPQQFAPQPQPQPQQPAASGPQISWGKCPQLEPSDKEKVSKATVITKCLENTPLPANITRDTVEIHREQIAACALQSEGWFTPSGSYDFNKAENEIKNKKLNKQIEDQVLNYHKQCKVEAEEKFPASKRNVIGQIQLYQACMDYFISDVCGIEVNEPEAPQFTGAQF